jgi:diacylglycerol kinase family enzyme
MNVFVYDAFLSEKKYERTLNRIETRLTDLGLNGKIVRLGVLKNIMDAVGRELKQGAKTIVAVGNNRTLNQIVNAQAAINPSELPFGPVPIGLIPVGAANNDLAAVLGVPPEDNAGDVIAARRIETLDLGQANEYYFFGHARINNAGTVLEIDHNFSLEIMGPGEIKVLNIPSAQDLGRGFNPNPKDRRLELYIEARTSKLLPLRGRTVEQSVFSFSHLYITNKNKPLVLDGAINLPTPVEIKIAPRQLPFIVGKERGF